MISKMPRTSRGGTTLDMNQKFFLIECVEKRPCIWDMRSESLKNNTSRQTAFNEIAVLMSNDNEAFTRAQIQEEWGKLRYCFTRIAKKFLENENDDEEAVSWPYWSKMQFLLDTIKIHLATVANNTTTVSTVTSGDEEIHQEELAKVDIAVSPKSFSRKRRSTKTLKRASTDNRNGNISFTNPTFSSNFLSANALTTAIANTQMLLSNHTLVNINHEQEINLEENQEKATSENFNVLDYIKTLYSRGATDQHHEPSNFQQKRRISVDECLKNIEIRSEPNLTVKETSPVATQMNNGFGTSYLLNNLPKVSSVKETIDQNELEDNEAVNGGGTDINDFFGNFLVQQMNAISKKNAVLAVMMRKELMDICCKYELKACSDLNLHIQQ